MSEQGADRAGNKLGNAALIFAVGAALSMILFALAQWVR